MLRLALTLIATQVVILLVLRPLILWYFKIPRKVNALEAIDASLRCLPAVRDADQRSGRKPARAA